MRNGKRVSGWKLIVRTYIVIWSGIILMCGLSTYDERVFSTVVLMYVYGALPSVVELCTFWMAREHNSKCGIMTSMEFFILMSAIIFPIAHGMAILRLGWSLSTGSFMDFLIALLLSGAFGIFAAYMSRIYGLAEYVVFSKNIFVLATNYLYCKARFGVITGPACLLDVPMLALVFTLLRRFIPKKNKI